MRSLTISLILTGLSFPRIKSNQILDEDNLAMQEELFLSKFLTVMNVTEYKVPSTLSINNLRNFLQMFHIIPNIITRGGWLGVNVTRLAIRSIRKGQPFLEILDLSPEYYIQNAFLEIGAESTEKENIGRRRRSQDGTCSLQRISVNLTEIGWDFVISPSLLEFRYCSGTCSVRDIPARMFIKQHGQIRYKLHKRGTFSLPPACCSPSEYEGVTMVYLDGHDENGRPIVRRGEFQNSLATACGCG